VRSRCFDARPDRISRPRHGAQRSGRVGRKCRTRGVVGTQARVADGHGVRMTSVVRRYDGSGRPAVGPSARRQRRASVGRERREGTAHGRSTCVNRSSVPEGRLGVTLPDRVGRARYLRTETRHGGSPVGCRHRSWRNAWELAAERCRDDGDWRGARIVIVKTAPAPCACLLLSREDKSARAKRPPIGQPECSATARFRARSPKYDTVEGPDSPLRARRHERGMNVVESRFVVAHNDHRYEFERERSGKREV